MSFFKTWITVQIISAALVGLVVFLCHFPTMAEYALYAVVWCILTAFIAAAAKSNADERRTNSRGPM